MRRLLKTALLTITALSFLTVGQAVNALPDQGKKVEEEIKRLEREWLIEPYFTSDMTAYDRIVADDFTITHSNGKVLNKAEKRANIIADHITDPSSQFRIGESRVRVYGRAAVSVGYIAEGASTVRFTNTYVKRNGRWQVVASQLNRVRQQ
ncbi:MAG: nuclear transport factor 2 family protein [Acidobacteriota bacterium]|nr:nuclear transport factor 2 family protein [Acidobacteriota bacterium]